MTNPDGTTRTVGGWAGHSLAKKVGAFVDGGGNFLASVGIPLKMAIAIMAVLVASFAATTLDTATRLQRYVIQELAQTMQIKPLTNRYAATALALFLGGAVALMPGPNGPGSGGLILWPLFRCSESVVGGARFYGDGVLSAATESTSLVRSDPDGSDVDYAGVGDAVADV